VLLVGGRHGDQDMHLGLVIGDHMSFLDKVDNTDTEDWRLKCIIERADLMKHIPIIEVRHTSNLLGIKLIFGHNLQDFHKCVSPSFRQVRLTKYVIKSGKKGTLCMGVCV
jgi:hypothetical protein